MEGTLGVLGAIDGLPIDELPIDGLRKDSLPIDVPPIEPAYPESNEPATADRRELLSISSSMPFEMAALSQLLM
jgi:hypothetical protein